MKSTVLIALALCTAGCQVWTPTVDTLDVISPRADAVAVTPQPVPPPEPAVNKAPIEVCFVVDTTGSMGGLIEGAKQKIWSIANQIVKDNPKRPLKMALVPFRDRGDKYVTKVIDLTDDLDALYKELTEFKADGGGDQPESVNQALAEAVEKVSWSPVVKGQDETTRLLFLVGDSPPHMDYQDDVKYPVTLQKAMKMNIVINTIQCGTTSATTPFWQEIAKLGEGTYLALSQTGNMTAVATPVDKKIVELNKELAKTVVPVGTAAVREEVRAKAAAPAAMPTEAAADRASYNLATGGKAVQGKGDLVEEASKNKEVLKTVKAEELPDELRKMDAKTRTEFIESQIVRRQQINAELSKAAADRDAYIKTQAATQPAPGAAFDQAVKDTIQNQANRKNNK